MQDGGKDVLGLGPSEMPTFSFYPSDWSTFACDKFGYDLKSTQKWTQRRPFYIAHEATARNMQYVREDFGPMPIHKNRPKKPDKHRDFACRQAFKKLAETDKSL